MSTSTQQQLVDFMVERLGLLQEEITPTSRFKEDLGLDSLDMVELVSVLEGELGMEVDDTAVESLATLDDAVAYIESRRSSAEAGV